MGTAPVTIQRASKGGKIFSDKAFNVSFMVPFAFQPNPPRPSESNVEIAADAQLVKHATDLFAALKSDGVQHNPDQFWTAGYDSPYQLFNRHNEIWVARD